MRTEWRGGVLHVRIPRLPPLELHWTLLLGMLFFGRGTLGGALGFFVLVLGHELGHAALVRARGLRTIAIAMHWMGGECRYDGGSATPLDQAIIAWGGVLAQAAILVPALVLAETLAPGPGVVAELLSVLVVANLLMIVLNLLPIPALDGGRAWQVFGLLRRRRARGRLEQQKEAIRRQLDELERAKRGDRTIH